MKRLLYSLLGVSLVTLLVAACAPYVRSDVNTALIGQVRCASFAWAGEFRSNSALRSSIANPVNESRLRAAIAAHLGGIVQPAPGNADCLIGYGIGGYYAVSGVYPYPYGWGWGYPYGYYGGYDNGYYGSSYGYGGTSASRVAELQSRLASAGYYHGAIDGILGPATRRAIRAYERDHGYAS